MKYIKLKTKIPNQKDVDYVDKLLEIEPRSMHGQLPIVWAKAKDCNVYDRHGNKFLDFTSGICVTNAGHGNTAVVKALKNQLDKPLLYTYTFPHEVRYKFIKKLVSHTKLDKAFLVSSGTEATECAVKLMRLNGMAISPTKNKIISFYDSMHGRTALTQQLKGKDDEWVGYKDPNIIHIPFPEDEYDRFGDALLRAYMGKLHDICGVIIESYQGWSARFLPDRYIKDLVSSVRAMQGLICFDDVQAGLGRTGKNFGYEHYKIKPDLVCLGKGISGSVPLAAVIGKKEIMDIPHKGSMSSTHSANPLSCAAGLAVLNQLPHLTSLAKAKESILKKGLTSLPDRFIINGRGLVWAIMTKGKAEADKIVLECFKRGLLLIHTGRNSIKIAPPLTITKAALEEGLKVIREVVL